MELCRHDALFGILSQVIDQSKDGIGKIHFDRTAEMNVHRIRVVNTIRCQRFQRDGCLSLECITSHTP